LPLLVDLTVSSAALTIVALAGGSRLFPALPIAPLLLVGVYGALQAYVARPTARTCMREARAAWPLRLSVAALFVWSASLLSPLGAGSELTLFGLVLAFDIAAPRVAAPLFQRLGHVERWVLVGDEPTAKRLREYEPLRAYANVVGAVAPSHNGFRSAGRFAALEAVDRYRADRVVIASQQTDEDLLESVCDFKSIGVPVSMLASPLDLLEAPAATPNQVGGVPLIDVEALATPGAVPYSGPDRRRDRRTRVSVVVPAMNEGRNIGQVLSRLPDHLHEVILVDGNSEDDTVGVARRAYPSIRVLAQSGRGKGDAFRTGFAAATGNLVVMLDADGSADPAEISRFVAALETGADFAKGSRFLEGGGSDDITPLRQLGNTLLSGSANLLHGTRFTDLCYGYNAFWARCLPFIAVDAPGFEVETLINLRLADAGMRIAEVPSYEANRISGQSNLKTFRDGFRVLGTILTEARRRRAIRSPHQPADRQDAEKTRTDTA
jgi:hypothetical protein